MELLQLPGGMASPRLMTGREREEGRKEMEGGTERGGGREGGEWEKKGEGEGKRRITHEMQDKGDVAGRTSTIN